MPKASVQIHSSSIISVRDAAPPSVKPKMEHRTAQREISKTAMDICARVKYNKKPEELFDISRNRATEMFRTA